MSLLNRNKPAASGNRVEKEVTIVNRLGMHARPAAMFVRIASRYRSEVW
ncbi:MAG: HPr family phosphocarrier protein, partial [Chthoniobacterales bacterium]